MKIYHIKNAYTNLKEFNNKFDVDNKAMSNIRIEYIGKDESLTPIEIEMRDRKTDSIKESNFIIIENLYPTDGKHWFLLIRRRGRKNNYFDSFGVVTPPLFLKDFNDLGSYEGIQEYNESY